MKIQLSLLALAASLLAGCGDKEPAKPTPAADTKPADKTSSGSPITAPVDYLGAIAKSKKTAEKVIGNTSLDKAIEQFHVQEGRYPLNLEELITEKYISGIPVPPYGQKIEYDAAKGKVNYVPAPVPPPAK